MFRKAQQGPGTVGRGGEAGGPPGGNGLRVTQSPGDMHVTGSSCTGATCWLCTPHAHPSPVTLHRGSQLQGLGTGQQGRRQAWESGCELAAREAPEVTSRVGAWLGSILGRCSGVWVEE